MSAAPFDLRLLDSFQLDALREVSNIGAGHAATALSQMTGRRIMVDVPEVRVLRLEDVGAMLGDPGEVVTAVTIRLDGELTGRMAQVFPESTARRLSAHLLAGAEPDYPALDPMARSALAEVGNIIVGAYLNVLSEFLGLRLAMSVPALETDMAAAVMTTITLNFDLGGEDVVCVNTRLGVEAGADLPAHFLLLPDADSLVRLMRVLRVA